MIPSGSTSTARSLRDAGAAGHGIARRAPAAACSRCSRGTSGRDGSAFSSLDDFLLACGWRTTSARELVELLERPGPRIDHARVVHRSSRPRCRWSLHAKYTRSDVLAALGIGEGVKPPPSREGRHVDAATSAMTLSSSICGRRSVTTRPPRCTATTRSTASCSTGSRSRPRRPTSRASVAGSSISSEAATSCYSSARRSAPSSGRSRSRSSGR